MWEQIFKKNMQEQIWKVKGNTWIELRWTWQIAFLMCCTNFHSCTLCTRVPVSHTLPTCMLSTFPYLQIQEMNNSMVKSFHVSYYKWREMTFKYLKTTCSFIFHKLFLSFAHFSIGLLTFFLLGPKSSLYIKEISSWSTIVI